MRPRASLLLGLEAAVAIGALLVARGRPDGGAGEDLAGRSDRTRALVVILAVLTTAAWLVFLVGAVSDSMWATDFVAFWGYKGKVIFLSSDVPRRLFQDPALYFAHREYPLLVSLSLAALATVVGQWNDQALALLYPACALVTLLAISGFLERRVSRLSGAVAASLASLCFFLYRPANAGTAEVPFALGLVLVCCAAGDFLRQDAPARNSFLSRSCRRRFVLRVPQAGGDPLRLSARRRPLVVDPPRTGAPAAVRRGGPRDPSELPLGVAVSASRRPDPARLRHDPVRAAAVDGIAAAPRARGGPHARHRGAPGRRGPARDRRVFPGDPAGDPRSAPAGVRAAARLLRGGLLGLSFDPMYAVDGAFRRIVMTLFPAFTLVLGARALAGDDTQTGRLPTA